MYQTYDSLYKRLIFIEQLPKNKIQFNTYQLEMKGLEKRNKDIATTAMLTTYNANVYRQIESHQNYPNPFSARKPFTFLPKFI